MGEKTAKLLQEESIFSNPDIFPWGNEHSNKILWAKLREELEKGN